MLIVFEPADGGVAEHVRLLVPRLAEHGWDVECAGPRVSTAYETIEAAGIPVSRLDFEPGLRRPITDLAMAVPLARTVRRRRIDVVHTHSTKAGIAGRIAARIVGVPAVHTPHAWSFTGEHPPARRLLSIAVERLLAPLSAAMICVSEHERREALRAGLPASRLRVVRNGTPACPTVEPAPELMRLRSSGPVVAMVASLRPQKRIDVFLDAVPLILEAAPTSSAALVGDGPLESALRTRVEALGLATEPRFAFLGFSGPTSRYLHAIDVLVLSSGWESLPIALLEALACGVPQVATNVGGCREIVTPDTGLLVQPGHPRALATATVTLLRNPAMRHAMSRASRVRHQSGFCVERMVAETAAVYADVVDSRR